MKKYFPIVLILIIAAIFRVYHNLDVSIWHDEAFSALLVQYNWSEMLYRIGLDVHPPMYYIFLKLWAYLFGNGVPALRGFSVIFGVATVWAVWMFVKTAFTQATGSGPLKNFKTANWAAFLVAANLYIVNFSTEARMYTFGSFFSVMAAYFLVCALSQQKKFYQNINLKMPNLPEDLKLKRSFLWHYLGFVVCTAIIILTHYYLIFTALALCVYALAYHIAHYRLQLKRYAVIAAAYLLIVASFLPWLKTFLFQLKQVGQGYWIPPMTIWSIPGTIWTVLLNIYHEESGYYTQKIFIVLFLFSVFFFWRFLQKTDSWSKWLVLLLTTFPFLGAVSFALLSYLKGGQVSVYQERFLVFASIFFIIAFSGWLSEIKTKWLAACLFGIYSIYSITTFFYRWYDLDIKNKPGMKGAARYISGNVEPGQHVFVGVFYEFFNYKYYEEKYYPVPTRPLVFTNNRSDIKQISHIEGVAILTNQDLVPDFSKAVKKQDKVWLLWTDGFYAKKPTTPFNWTEVGEKSFDDIRPWIHAKIYVTEYRVN